MDIQYFKLEALFFFLLLMVVILYDLKLQNIWVSLIETNLCFEVWISTRLIREKETTDSFWSIYLSNSS